LILIKLGVQISHQKEEEEKAKLPHSFISPSILFHSLSLAFYFFPFTLTFVPDFLKGLIRIYQQLFQKRKEKKLSLKKRQKNIFILN